MAEYEGYKPLRAIGDSGRISALIGSVWRAGVLMPLTPFQQFGVVTAITDRVRVDCSRVGSAAAMIVVGAYQNLRLRHTMERA